MKNKKRLIILIIAYVVFLVVFGNQLYLILLQPSNYQWDFKRYYYAGRLSLLDRNPYDLKEMIRLFGNDLPLKQAFIYPPYTIFIFRALATLDVLKAYYLFFAIKIFIYLMIISIWKNFFFKDTNLLIFLLFISLSVFSECIYLDFRAGNVSIIEQFFFWVGILFFFRRKIMFSGIFLLLSSLFKLLYIPFLLLFIINGLYSYFYILLIILAAGIFATSFISPFYSMEFLKNNSYLYAHEEFGHISVSSRSLFIDLFIRHRVINYGLLYIVLVALIIAVSFYIIRRNYNLLRSRSYLLVYFFIVIYCLVTPRLKDYGQIILIPPAYFLLDYFLKRKALFPVTALIFLYFILSPHYFFPLRIKYINISLWNVILKPLPDVFSREIMHMLQNYHILFTIYIMWIIYIFIILKEKGGMLENQPRPNISKKHDESSEKVS